MLRCKKCDFELTVKENYFVCPNCKMFYKRKISSTINNEDENKIESNELKSTPKDNEINENKEIIVQNDKPNDENVNNEDSLSETDKLVDSLNLTKDDIDTLEKIIGNNDSKELEDDSKTEISNDENLENTQEEKKSPSIKCKKCNCDLMVKENYFICPSCKKFYKKKNAVVKINEEDKKLLTDLSKEEKNENKVVNNESLDNHLEKTQEELNENNLINNEESNIENENINNDENGDLDNNDLDSENEENTENEENLEKEDVENSNESQREEKPKKEKQKKEKIKKEKPKKEKKPKQKMKKSTKIKLLVVFFMCICLGATYFVFSSQINQFVINRLGYFNPYIASCEVQNNSFKFVSAKYELDRDNLGKAQEKQIIDNYSTIENYEYLNEQDLNKQYKDKIIIFSENTVIINNETYSYAQNEKEVLISTLTGTASIFKMNSGYNFVELTYNLNNALITLKFEISK